MEYSKIYAASLFSLLVISGTDALAVAPAGQDNKVEWSVQQTWPITGKTLSLAHSLDGKLVYVLNDKQQVQVFNSQGELQGSIPVEKGVSNIDVAPQGETLYVVDNDNKTYSSIAVSLVINVDITGSPFKGPADAPVTIALFTDFE